MPAPTATIIITTIPTQQAGVPFLVSGTYVLNSATWNDQLIYADNSGAHIPIAAETVALSTSSWSFSHGGMPAGTHTVSIRDPLTGTIATSNSFSVIAAKSITPTTVSGSPLAGAAFTFAGTLTGYTTAPNLTYQILGPLGQNAKSTTAAPVTGVTTSAWSMQLTLATAGNYSISVSDGAISASLPVTIAPATTAHVITPTLPGSVSAGATFAFTGTLSGYATPPTLTYVINNGAPIPITGVTSTGWSMQIVAPTAAGGYNLVVADGTTSGQATLTVTSQAKVITPTAPSGVRAGQSFTFQGLLSGYATIPALTYTLSGGSPVAMTGVSVTGWAMTVTIPTAGSYTVTVSDGTNTSPPASFTVTAANVVLRNWYENPGMDGSFWVQPFQSSANWITTGSLITALRGGTPTVNTTGNYSPPTYIGTSSDPQVTVTDGTHTEIVRLPIGATFEGPTSQYDQSMGGVDATRPYFLWSISGATIYDANNNVIGAINGPGCTIRGTYGFAVQDGAGLVMVDAVTGAPGDNNSIGGIQSLELAKIAADPNYVIQHMLAFQTDVSFQASSAGPIWPLLVTDTSSGGSSTPYAGPIPQGITIGIPASVRRPTGQTRGFYALWDCMQQFGAFNYNFGQVGGVNIAVYDAAGTHSSLVSDIVASWPTVAAQLCILNYANGVSGAQYSLATTKGAIPGSTNAFPAPPPLDLSPTGGKNVAPSTFGAWYPSGYNATPTNSTTSGGGATFIITPNAPVNVVVATAFTFSGTLSGYSTAPTLTYALNGAAPVAMTGVTAQGWSMSLTVQTTGATTVVVTDATNVASGSVSFQVFSTAPASNPVSWNPSTATGGITLSNNNYTATATGSATSYSTPQGVLATTALSTSQPVLWEVTFSAVTQNAAVGVASAAAALSTTGGMGADANSIGFYPSTGTGSQPAQTVYSSGNQLTAGNGVSAGAGAVITCVVNGTNIYFSDAAMRSTSGVAWNNSTTANPASNSGGFSFAGIGTPYYAAFATGEAGAVAVMNDGTQPLSAFATSFLAANPSVVTISGAASATPAKSIMPGTPSGVVTGAPFTFSGTLSGYSSVPTLTYQLNGGTVTALGGVTQTGWSATLVTQVSGSNVITVSDGTVNASVNFSTGAASGGGTRVAAPLTGSVTTGTWNLGLRYSQANSPSGLGYMVYNVLPPAQYNPNVLYPILFVGHPDNDGGGSNYPKDPGSFVTGQAYGAQYSIDSMYNTVAFRTAFPCFVVACQCDQTLGDSNPNGNFGGYADSQMSGWNEQAEAGIANALIGQYPIDPGRRYHIGYSLGGIGTLAQLVDNNQYNGPALKLWTAGITYSDQLYRPNTPNSNVFSRMASVPLLTISTTSDNVPSSYDEPAWQTYTGNSNYPGKSQYDSGGMAAVRAGTTQYYYINYGSANPATTFMPMNALGGDGDKAYQWLFSQVFGGTGPTITGATFTPAATVIANSAKGTVAGSLLAGSSGGALTGITYTLSSTTNFAISGSNVLFNTNAVAQGTYPLTVSVTAANASNSPQSYTITILVASSATGGTGPAASGSFINIDFANTTAFFSGQTQTVSPYVWGFSTGALGNSNCADMTDATFRASTAKLRPTLIRFNANLGLVDGGASASMTNFINNYQSCFSSNVRIVMGINFSDSTTAVTNFANAMVSAGLPIHYWELGNETDGSVTTAAYITKFNAVAAALHAVDASYLLGGPVWSWWDGGDGTNPLQTFAAGVGSNLGFVSFHSYGTQSGSGPINYGLTYTDVTSVRQALNAAGISSSVPIGLLEYNQNGTPPGDITQAQSFGAVYAALMVIGSLNQDRNFTMGGLWDIEQDSYYGAISNNSTGFGNIDPQGWTLGVAGQTVTGTRVGPASPVVGSQNIAVLPTVNGTNFGVMIVNYSTSSSYSGQVALSHLPGYSTGSGTITRTITSTGSAPVTTTLAVTNGIVASDTIPAQSVVIYTQGTQSTSAGTFKVSGGKVLKPDGTTFKGLGISFWDNQLTSGITNAACQPMLTLFPGVNMVRLARVDSTFWSPDTYAQQINWMTAKGIVVVIENHRTSNGQTGGGGQGSIYTGALLQQEQNWYSALATYFKDNTYVWFGTCNEPPADNQLAALWQWQQTTYNTIRATGSNAIVEMEQGNPYLQGSNSGLSNTIFSQMHNIVFGPHYYSWIWGGNGSTVVPQSTIYSSSIGSANSQYGGIVQQVQTLQALTSADGVVPVGCYEFGPSTTGTGVDASGMNCVKAVIQAVHNGDLFCFMAWLWGNIGDDNLQTASGAVQSPYGTTIAAAITAG